MPAPDDVSSADSSDGPNRPGSPVPVSGGMASRAVWTAIDQAVSSIANAALSIVLARTVSSTEFGTFALSLSLYSFLIGISQAVNGQVLSIRYSRVTRSERLPAVGSAAGVAVVLGAISGLLMIGAVAIIDLPASWVVVSVGLLLPGLLLQDAWRTALISAGTPKRAFINDLVWTTVQFVLIAILLVRSESAAVWYVLAWGFGALLAAALGVLQTGQRPVLTGGLAWLSRHRDVSGYLLAQWLAVLGTTQVAFVILASVGGVESVGSLRAAQTLLGPLNLVAMAISAFVVPELVRARPERRQLAYTALALSSLVLLVAAGWGAVLLVLPDAAGRELLGDTWPSAREALPGMVAFYCAIGLTTGPGLLFRALGTTRYTFWTGAVLGPGILVFAVAGQVVGDVSGAAWGFAVAALSVVPFSVQLCARALREHVDVAGGADPTSSTR